MGTRTGACLLLIMLVSLCFCPGARAWDAYVVRVEDGNTISVSVPTTELREEILRNKTGMLMRIAELAGISGAIELEVIVNEEIRAARPIKLEDRVKHMTEKNPLIAELRKALDLEVE